MNQEQLTPRVSVVIPTYNRADLLVQAIDSVLNQTFTDFEILIVDDGSTDETEKVVSKIRDNRLIYISQEHSGLPAVARNKGIRRARGEYIAFLDSDDLWLPSKLAVQLERMDKHPRIGLVYSNAYRFTDDCHDSDSQSLLIQPGNTVSGHAFARLYGRPVIPNLTVVIRATVVDKIGLLDEDPRLKANEDYEYWLRIAHHYPISYIDQPLAGYRHHPKGISKATVAKNQSKLFLVEKLDHMYPHFVEKHKEKRRQWLAHIHYGLGRGLLREDKVEQARKHFRESWSLLPRIATGLFMCASFLGKPTYQLLDGAKTNLLSSQSFIISHLKED